jgi:hypothetical protein
VALASLEPLVVPEEVPEEVPEPVDPEPDARAWPHSTAASKHKASFIFALHRKISPNDQPNTFPALKLF